MEFPQEPMCQSCGMPFRKDGRSWDKERRQQEWRILFSLLSGRQVLRWRHKPAWQNREEREIRRSNGNAGRYGAEHVRKYTAKA